MYPPAMAANPSSTRELRLALVLYGGVSLAIYMHGVTKELNKLVAASRALDLGDENPFEVKTTEHVYFNALKQLRTQTGVRTQVVVDIISGTSAGGINGVYLAKALAGNVGQDGLSKLWLEKGDIAKLVRGRRVAGVIGNWKAKLARNVIQCVRQPKLDIAPLRGDVMCRWYWQALDDMDSEHESVAGLSTLMPDDHDLQLFVTITDFYGYGREIPINSPPLILDSRHRHVFEFRRDARVDHFGADYNDGLAFACRGTSSFPGAFPAISFADFEQCFDPKHDLADFDREFCRAYALTGADARGAHFVDGGVLDNFPFDHAIRAIRRRPAAVEVDRRLLYVEPDPRPPAGPEGRTPGWPATVAAGMSAIPAKEPILDQLLALMTFNERVRTIRDIIEISFDTVRTRVSELAASLTADGRAASDKVDIAALLDQPSDRLEAVRRGITDAAHANANATDGYPTYARIKIESVVDCFASLVSKVREFPDDSNHAFFVRNVFRQWAREEQLFVSGGVPTPKQKAFLKAYDVPYERRLLQFLIAAINWWYDAPTTAQEVPSRTQLDSTKRQLWKAVAQIDELLAGGGLSEQLTERLAQTFSDEAIRQAIATDGLDATSFRRQFAAEVETLRTDTHQYIEKVLTQAGGVVHQVVVEATKEWPHPARGDLVARYLGFPFWDIMLFPVQALADAGEGDAVEVVRASPLDSYLLHSVAAEKLQGVAAHHFGAFFNAEARANDYLWGRLDGVERLLGLLLAERDPTYADSCVDAFEAVLAEERELPYVDDVVAKVQAQLGPIRQLIHAAKGIECADATSCAQLADELNRLIGGALVRLDARGQLTDGQSVAEAEKLLGSLVRDGTADGTDGHAAERIRRSLAERPRWPFADVQP
jgi:patatin-related protein